MGLMDGSVNPSAAVNWAVLPPTWKSGKFLIRQAKIHTCGDPLSARQRMREWFNTTLGAAFAAEESKQLCEMLETRFGYHLLQLGHLSEPDYFCRSSIRLKLVMDESIEPGETGVGLLGDFCALPVATDSVDLVILPHTLETSADPHQVLREVDRVLVPEGIVIVLGFNPWSLWGVRRLLSGRSGKAPWCAHFFSPFRVKDWLSLLGFDVLQVQPHFYRLPIGRKSVFGRLDVLMRLGARLWPAFGAGYVLVARKRVSTLTPIGPLWRRRPIISHGLLEPSRCIPKEK